MKQESPASAGGGSVQKGFAFVSPKVKQDFFDEAVSQANCLASYVDKFTNGECMILFMRNKRTPETSYITAEVIGGKVTQAKLAKNVNISPAEREILDEWVKKCNKKKVEEKPAG